jgi:hypothetical protein
MDAGGEDLNGSPGGVKGEVPPLLDVLAGSEDRVNLLERRDWPFEI